MGAPAWGLFGHAAPHASLSPSIKPILPPDGAPDPAGGMQRISQGIFLASMMAVGAATAAAGIVILRTRVWPVWLAWVGFLIAVLALPVIPPLSFLGALVLALWALVISVLLLRPATP